MQAETKINTTQTVEKIWEHSNPTFHSRFLSYDIEYPIMINSAAVQEMTKDCCYCKETYRQNL